MTDELSNFRSAIEWPDFSSVEEIPTGEFKPLGAGLRQAVEAVTEAVAISPVTESPIETLFGARFALRARRLCKQIGLEFAVAPGNADLVLQPQFPLGRFRYDFAIRAKGRQKPLALVECDGKDFHSTAEQQANDALKDAAALKANIQLIRFTGSEINRDADECSSLLLSAALSALQSS